MSKENPTTKEILTDWLKAHGFDGLCSVHLPCACEIDDLCPCDDIPESCQAGYKWLAEQMDPADCEEPADWYMRLSPPAAGKAVTP